MRSIIAVCLLIVVALAAGRSARGELKAEIVESRRIWERAPHNAFTDLVRFQDRLYCVLREGTDAHSSDGAIRVLSSADGSQWEPAAIVRSPIQHSGLHDPKLAVTPAGELFLTAAVSVPGDCLRSMAWRSRDGREWSSLQPVCDTHFYPGRVAMHRGKAYVYSYGTICGSAQTVKIGTSDDFTSFNELMKETFSGFFPYDGALAFDGDSGFCLMTRSGSATGFLGTSKPPFTSWTWKPLDRRIANPNLLRLPKGQILASVGLHDHRARTSLCMLDPVAGKLREIVELPAQGAVGAGLALEGGHLWASFHAPHEGKPCVFVAKIKLVRE
jgi:hypothetical protein